MWPTPLEQEEPVDDWESLGEEGEGSMRGGLTAAADALPPGRPHSDLEEPVHDWEGPHEGKAAPTDGMETFHSTGLQLGAVGAEGPPSEKRQAEAGGQMDGQQQHPARGGSVAGGPAPLRGRETFHSVPPTEQQCWAVDGLPTVRPHSDMGEPVHDWECQGEETAAST